MKFKTNGVAKDNAEAITSLLRKKFPDVAVEYEIESADKLLHIHGIPEDSIHVAEVENAIREAGFEGSWLTRGEENK